MRDYKSEFDRRVEFIKNILNKSGADGIVYGNSGGKDSALVGILCKAACDNTINKSADVASALSLLFRYLYVIYIKKDVLMLYSG